MLVFIGAVAAAAFTWNSGLRFTRGRFCIYLALILALFLLAGWALSAAAADFASILRIFTFAGLLASGSLLWIIASARCRDAYGSVYLAIVMLIPLPMFFLGALPFLLFKASMPPEPDEGDESFVPDDAASDKSWFNNGLTVAIGVCILGVAASAVMSVIAINSLGKQLDATFDRAATSAP